MAGTDAVAIDDTGEVPTLYRSTKFAAQRSIESTTSNSRMLSAPSYNDNKKFEKVAKRADSSNFRIDNMTANAWKLVAGEGFKRIISNLQQQHLCNARMIRGNFEYLLPQNDWSEHQIKVFQALQQAPMIVPTSNLKEILSLESSTITSELTSPGHHFYVRSWTLARKELEDVLDYMTDEDQTFEETAQWRKVLDLYSGDKGPKFFTIRYVGTCEGPTRPYDRYAEEPEDSSRWNSPRICCRPRTTLPFGRCSCRDPSH
jgi:hypothetical protein